MAITNFESFALGVPPRGTRSPKYTGTPYCWEYLLTILTKLWLKFSEDFSRALREMVSAPGFLELSRRDGKLEPLFCTAFYCGWNFEMPQFPQFLRWHFSTGGKTWYLSLSKLNVSLRWNTWNLQRQNSIMKAHESTNEIIFKQDIQIKFTVYSKK